MANREEEWKDKGRPQSVMAQQFSATLDNIFGLDNTSERSDALEEKKKELSTQNRELVELEARLKAMEAKLKSKQTAGPSGGKQATNQASAAASPTQLRMGAGNTNIRRPPNAPMQQQQQQQRPARIQVSSESDEDSEEEEEEDTETEESSSEEEKKR